MTQLQVSKCLSTQQSEIRWKLPWQLRLVLTQSLKICISLAPSVSCGIVCVPWYRLCPVVSSVSRGIVCVPWYRLCPVVSSVSRGIVCVLWYRLCPVVSSMSRGIVCVPWYRLCPVVSFVSCGIVCVSEPGDSVVFIRRHRLCHS